VQQCVPNCTGSGLQPRDRDRLPVGCYLTWRYSDWNMTNGFQFSYSLTKAILVGMVTVMPLIINAVNYVVTVCLFVYIEWTVNKRWRQRDVSEWMEKSRGLSISRWSRDKTPRKATLQLATAHRTDGPNIRRQSEAHWGPPGRSAAPPTNENCIQSWQDFWKFCSKRNTKVWLVNHSRLLDSLAYN